MGLIWGLLSPSAIAQIRCHVKTMNSFFVRFPLSSASDGSSSAYQQSRPKRFDHAWPWEVPLSANLFGVALSFLLEEHVTVRYFIDLLVRH